MLDQEREEKQQGFVDTAWALGSGDTTGRGPLRTGESDFKGVIRP